MKIAGFVLLALGIIGLIYGGITYTTKETVLEVGSFRATANKEHSIPIAPMASAAMLAAGIALVVVSRRRG